MGITSWIEFNNPLILISRVILVQTGQGLSDSEKFCAENAGLRVNRKTIQTIQDQ